MTISAKIIADSISPTGVRLTTMQLRYPRFIHAEFMTHRVFSRNASSSRAIPVNRMIEDLRRDPAMPIYWGSNKPGMQAGAELPEEEEYKGLKLHPLKMAKEVWLDAMNDAISQAEELIALGLHKQIANRILEPWSHINVVVTATSYGNFFALRSHPDAQPEIKLLSDLMQAAMAEAQPMLIEYGQWHMPYVLDSDWVDIRNHITCNGTLRVVPTYEQMAKYGLLVSTARCARVSYKTHDGRKTTIEEDIKLAEKLIMATPLHASPSEHQARPDVYADGAWKEPQYHGNLKGWKQHRRMLPGGIVDEIAHTGI